MNREPPHRRWRILLVIAGLGPGGAERQMALLARTLDRNQFDVGLLIFNAGERVHYPDVFEQPLWFRALGLSRHGSRPPKLAMGMAMGIRRAVEDFKPDLIHTSLHVANVAVRAVGLLWFRNIPVVTSIRNDFLTGYPRTAQFTERLLCHRSSAIVVNADSTHGQLATALGLSERRVVTIENGVDPIFFPASMPVPTGWPDGDKVALLVGRFVIQKNFLSVIEALKALDAQNRLSTWRFVLVGEGPLRPQIEAAVADFPRLRLFPPSADLLPFYRNAELLILPSLYEGMSNVALEAQACGVPVALTPGANASGVVADGCGWLLEGELAGALAAVLQSPVSEFSRRGELAREDIAKRFGMDRLARKTEAVYVSCLNSSR